MARHADPFDPTPAAASEPAGPAPSIAILPAPTAGLAAAVTDGGGVVEPLSDTTVGLVLADVVGAPELETVLDEHPGIRWIQLYLAGVDQYEHLMLANRAREWTSGKGAFGQPVGEFALTLTLAIMRGVPDFARAELGAAAGHLAARSKRGPGRRRRCRFRNPAAVAGIH